MKMANGMGTVYKLSGKRRNPWIARKTKGWEINEQTGKAKQLYITIGYYSSRSDALAALINYNENPYDIDSKSITFAEVYERWSKVHFETIVRSAQRTSPISNEHNALPVASSLHSQYQQYLQIYLFLGILFIVSNFFLC